MRSGVRPGRQTEREERDSGVATVGVGSVCSTLCTGRGQVHHTPAQVSRPYPGHRVPTLHSSGVLWQTGEFMLAYITSAAAATILTAADR